MMRLLVPAVVVSLLAACAAPPPEGPVALRILAINDFHGNLKPSAGGIRIPDPADPSKRIVVPAGGSEHLATAVQGLRAGHRNTIFVAAGDLIGASPLLSALFHDEPTVESLSMMGLAASAVGNHEFDEGWQELLRMQAGGCHPKDGCRGPQPYRGAGFQYLAASTIDTATGRTILPAYILREFDGIPVAFIGLTLKGTPGIVTPAGVAGLDFRDEAETVNALVPELRAKGVEAIVVLIHEGGMATGGHNECPAISGAIVEIVGRLDRAVDLVVSGHTHQAYNCVIDGRLVTSADKYGTVVSAIDVTLDRRSRDVTMARADNVIVRTAEFAKDPAQTKLIAAYETLAAPLEGRVVGRIAAPLSREVNGAGESVLGNIIADAQLAATQAAAEGGAELAFMNPGGVRADLVSKSGGPVTYGDLFTVQPFSNALVTMSLTGAQIVSLLEQQWLNQPRPRILHVARGFSYAWDAARPEGSRVVPGSVRIGGQPVDPVRRYRVTVNEFLASGGDGFAVLREGQQRVFGRFDVDALEAWVAAHSPLAAGPLDRIRRLN
ncbi:bifunctional metallophosphatase/5'-nucleotidase [Ferrovibrio sp.]|uniref:bifunctional metallophosphatase/5'-nucleotidase n=1 Tax=Ferrovibrio sp. TaxID=1917215 RepID=UPI00311E4734